MPTEAKRATIASLREELSRSQALIVSEYRGLRVGELAEIRRALRKQGVSCRVVKNRLMKIAAGEEIAGALDPLLAGPTAIAFGSGDASSTAKAVIDATRAYRVVHIKGAVLGRRTIDAEGVSRLATLPSREVLQAQLAGALQSPIAMLGGLLNANLRNFAYALQQLADRKAGAGA